MYYWDFLGVLIGGADYVSVVVRRMYYWDAEFVEARRSNYFVSVVVRRMYYWDSRWRLIFPTAPPFQ